ncbi:MAG: YhbY family RNA-binding protein [Rhodoferax sp.]
MAEQQLTPTQRRQYRAEAHHLDPVVMIGCDGLTEAVVRETDAALNAHGLIKVRAACDDRTTRETWLHTLADRLGAAPVQHIGKLLVLWRPKPTKEKTSDEPRKPGPRAVKVLKFGKPGRRPEVKVLRVLGNQRLSAGGLVKRAKPRTVSIKKRPASGGTTG